MTFNWFNRFNKEEENQPEPAPAAETPVEETPAEETPSKEDARIANARAIVEAFRRKQREQAEQAPETPEVVEEEALEPVEAIVAESEPVEAPEVVESSETVSEAVEPEIEQAEPESTEEVALALPFWAQSQADTQARLERLRATAIEEPTEPEPVVEAPKLEPAFTIDEGFLWSADVLSAMGRRAEDVSIEEITWLKRLRQGLDKTRRSLVNQLKAIVGQGPLNQDAVYEIESLLLQADAGVEATDKIIEALQAKLRQETLPPDQAIAYLKQILRDLLDQPLQGSHSAFFAPEKDTLNIWLMTGVNGAGKTTTLGKLAHIATKSGYKCLIGAADTFRAAAVEQVKVWGQRSNVEVIANPGQNTDPAAVVFDAISAAQSRGTELLLIDTAGRLQNKKNLMDELSKVRRIIDKKAGDAKVESLLVLDATLGQNGLKQAEVFAQAAQLSGVVLTKLDGTAKGGIALAVVEQLGLPIRFIGAGEGIEDLRPFSSYEFVEALISG
ncbi:signal recognition particle-docking protein FtsY [Leptolyngbya sp. NIES-2104]|uniref:signal recognition particle-docking protein FtsY n=1 Tax=Leptolyngbya sp. NIES-2104 TaxID=1552121 RepID=UPI0006ECCD85|nr:signal recognition particle-docking protein FtsY [Leptolyngbya sp. NIES-2104]GAP94365.1 signal recognition particle receptor protein FtsY [Leptolyngbya sp. NIES-2104]